MLLSEESWTIEVLTVHLEVRIPEVYQPLTEDELDWNWHHWKKIESLLRYPEPYYAKELTRIVLEINEAVNGTKERLYGDQRDFIIGERVFHDMESAAIGGAFVITRVPEKKLPKLQGTAVAPHLKPQDSVDEKLTFIGVILKDQDDEPVVNSRVRIKLPDGDIKNGRTNAAGEVMVKGFVLDGMAEIELLDFCDPGKAEAIEEEEQQAPATEEKEFIVKVVDETGKGVAGVPMVFRGAGTSKTVPTDSSGVAKHKAKAESVEVTFENSASLVDKMDPLWKSRAATPANKYLQEAADIVAVAARVAGIETLAGAV